MSPFCRASSNIELMCKNMHSNIIPEDSMTPLSRALLLDSNIIPESRMTPFCRAS